mmetsp:Transcript_56071/g.133553  ORF Transcript_56071/g.133553 Transcript_56071/m.133553 type:complete len:373 (-) Transcript_56071:86-1204(-)|eukprot:CAMPEP_0178399862 /NCGR_PEP_ID=MMETSP0689_2-20121128/15495_1 /TAXON_ID=160604 /ORGANISM="Amphidinium massartii, Strain CS-259" /LENGTH=372 /DNA_ID=CAMNT_0020020645 /DNA_START=125 /DNA_END=1243 /DNA_ORIENTATION=+
MHFKDVWHPLGYGARLVGSDHFEAAEESLRNVANTTATLLQHQRPWLMQAFSSCTSPSVACDLENTHVLLMLLVLVFGIVVVVCTFNFLREDKEEMITPLSPQLVVREAESTFRMPFEPLDAGVAVEFEVWDSTRSVLCKVSMDWPDPFKPGAAGVAATVRVQNSLDVTLATVVARSVAVMGQGIALCKTGCEIFGFVDVETENKYQVRHRSGVQLLTLIGDFEQCNVEGFNPAGTKVCRIHRVTPEEAKAAGEDYDGPVIHGRVQQHVDAGLVISSFLATQVHRRLLPGAMQFSAPLIDPTFHAAGLGPLDEQPSREDTPGEAPEDAEVAAGHDISDVAADPEAEPLQVQQGPSDEAASAAAAEDGPPPAA